MKKPYAWTISYFIVIGLMLTAEGNPSSSSNKDDVAIPYIWTTQPMRKGKPRPSTYPYITSDNFRVYADHIIDTTIDSFNPSVIKTGDIVYVFTPLLHIFFTKIHPRIQGPYVLITTNAANAVPADYHYYDKNFASGDFTTYLDDQKLIAWFGKNALGKHPKLFQIPIGLFNACFSKQGNIKLMEEVKERQLQKKYLLYMNFTVQTNTKVRSKVETSFKNKQFCYSCKKCTQKKYLVDVASSKFILSPEGCGIDCHRTWEALMMDSIPIITSSPLDEIYQDLPVLIVDDWNQVTEEFLNKKYEEFKTRTFNLEKLHMPYWITKIETVKKEFLLRT